MLNKSLDKYIIDYEKDVFGHDFFKDISLNTDTSYLSIDDTDKIEDFILDNLSKIQSNLKEYCINIIRDKKNLVQSVSTSKIFELYNGGNCLPDNYKNLQKKLYEVLEYPDDEISITHDIVLISEEFNIPFIYNYLDDIISNHDLANDFTIYNPIKFLCDNLDLMAEHLLGYCYREINQMNITSKKEWHEAIEARILEKNMTMKQYVVDLIEKELYKSIEAGILEKNTTMKQYVVDLIEKDLATVNNKKPVVETMYNENNESCDGVLDTDSDDNETLEKEQQRLIDILFEMNRMKDKKAKQLP